MRRALFFRYGLVGLLIAGTMILLVTAALSHSPFDLFPNGGIPMKRFILAVG